MVGGGGKSNRACSEGDGSRSLPHRAGSGVCLPKSSTLSLKTSLSMTEHEAESHNSRRNEGYPSFQMQSMASAKFGPRDVGVLESRNSDAHDTSPFCPSTQSHFIHPLSPDKSHPVHLPGPGLNFPPCTSSLISFSLTTSLFFLSLSTCPIPLSLIQCLSPYLSLLHLSPVFRLSVLSMQPCPGAPGTVLSPVMFCPRP